MKLKNEKEIGFIACEYADQNQKDRPQIAWVLFDVKEAYKKGFKDGHKAAALPLMKKIEEQKRIIKSEALLITSLSRVNIELQKENHWLLVQYKMGAQIKCENEKLQKENKELREALEWATKELSNPTGWRNSEHKSKEIRTKFNFDKEGES